MVDIVNELSRHRAKFACEALASSQGDALQDRYKNLSQHQTAELLGEEIPPVQGANSIRTEAYNARARARREEAALWSEEYDSSPWGAKDGRKEIRRHRRYVDALWDSAHKKSKQSGFEYYDRHGYKRNPGRKPRFIEEAVHIFLARYGTQWKRIRK